MREDNYTPISKTVYAPVFERRNKSDRRVVGSVDPASEPYQAGYSAGMENAEALFHERQIEQNKISKNVDCLLRELDARYRQECESLIKRIFETAAPALVRASLHAEVADIIEMYVVRQRQPVLVRAHPDMIEHLSSDAGESDLVNFEADPTLASSAIEVRWRDGGMFHDPGSFISDFTNLLATQNTTVEEQTHE